MAGFNFLLSVVLSKRAEGEGRERKKVAFHSISECQVNISWLTRRCQTPSQVNSSWILKPHFYLTAPEKVFLVDVRKMGNYLLH